MADAGHLAVCISMDTAFDATLHGKRLDRRTDPWVAQGRGRYRAEAQEAIAALAHSMHTVDYLKSLYRHGKTIVASSEDHPLLEQAGISPRLPNGDPDPGIVWLKGEVEGAMESIAAAVTRRQHPEREQAFAPGA